MSEDDDRVDVFAHLPLRMAVGTMQWGDTWVDSKVNSAGKGIIPMDQVQQMYDESRDLGVTLFDTAEGYGGGTSETRLGLAARHHGDRASPDQADPVLLASKFLPTLWRWRRADVVSAARASCERLGVQRMGVLFLHTPTHPRALETWVDGLCDAVEAGLTRHIAVSNCNAEQVARACDRAHARGYRIVANQIMFSLLTWASPELQRTREVCEARGVRIIGFGVLGQGLLTQSLTEARVPFIRAARIMSLDWDSLQPLRREMALIGDETGLSMAQVAVSWVVSKGAIPLVGVTRAGHAAASTPGAQHVLSPAHALRLERRAHACSTLSKPKWRRALFVFFISMLVAAYRVERLIRSIRNAVWQTT